jgi:hypothetical protein
MADANPGIGGLPAATLLTLDEFRSRPPAAAGSPADARPAPAPAGTGDRPAAPGSWRSGEDRPPPNLGPPPPRLDWRGRRSR